MTSICINREYLATMCGEDAEFEKELIESYLEASPSLVSAVVEGVTQGDADAVRDAAHTLKGSSRAIGADEVGQVSEILEQKSRTGDLDGTADLVAQLKRAYAELEKFAQATWPS